MDIKDSYLHGTVGVVKSISVDADKLSYKLADVNNTTKTVTLPTATQSANGLLSNTDKKKLDSIKGLSLSIPYIVGSTSDTTAGTWTGSYAGITEYTDGLTIIYVPKVAGASTTTLNINGLGAITCYYTNTSKLTTHYSVGTPIMFTYVGGYWRRADYDSWTPHVAAYCSTSASTAAKTASCSNYNLTAKSYVHVLIVYANTSLTALTLNINGKGAKPIYINGTASSASNYTLPAGTYIAYYDGTNFYFRTDGVLPGTIEKSKNATSADTATKLADNTAFTAWGQIFFLNGKPKTIAGDLKLSGLYKILGYNDNSILSSTSSSTSIAHQASEAGIDTYLNGNKIYLRYGKSHGIAMIITDGGFVGIGNSAPIAPLTIAPKVNGTMELGTTNGIVFAIQDQYKAYGINFNVKSSGVGEIQVGRTSGKAESFALNLNPLGGKVNIGAGGLNVAGTITGTLNGTANEVANSLILKINSGTTEGSSLYTYNGSSAKTLDIKNGTGIKFTNNAGSLQISNSGVRSVSTGTTNGTIRVNTGGTTTDVAVKGLDSAAYTKSSSYIQQVALSSVSDIKKFWELAEPYFGNAIALMAKFKDTNSGWGHLLFKAQNNRNTAYSVDGAGLFMKSTYFERWKVTGKDTEDDPLVLTKYKIYDEETLKVVSSTENGLTPKVINTNTATVGSAYYVLASTNGSATPSWYKLPATAFANDDTKVTQTNTTGSASYRVLLSGNANDTTETTTARKSGKLLFNPSTGNLINKGDITIDCTGDSDKFLNFTTTTTHSWRLGHLASGAGNSNYFVIQSSKDTENTWTNVLRLGLINLEATFASTVIAPTFQGNLDGTYVNKLTGYSKATAIGSIAATDSLKTALGKLEFKTDFIYNDLFGTDNDDVINKWHEIVDFVDSVAEDTDITDEFVTRKTALDITGLKRFVTNANEKPLIICRNSGLKEALKIGINDSQAIFDYDNDEKSSSFVFKMVNTDVEGSDGSGANTSLVTFNGSSSGSTVTATKFVGNLTGNATSTTKLQTSRKIWGLNFDGTADITGALSGATTITASSDITCGGYIKSSTTLYLQSASSTSVIIKINGGTELARFSTNGNVGIGTTSPTQKLHVSGNILATKFIKSGGTSSQFLKADGSVDSTTYATSASLGNYLPLTGGTITSSENVPLNIKTSNTYSAIRFLSKDHYRTFGVNGNGNLFVTDDNGWSNEYSIYHTGNLTKVSLLSNDKGYLTSRGYVGTTAVLASSAIQNLTGIGTANFSGVVTINTIIQDHATPRTLCLVIDSSAVPEGTTLTLKNSPGIGFHIGSRSWGSLVFNGKFNFINSEATSCLPVQASKFITDGGTSSQFVKGDGSLDSNKYLINTNTTHTSAYYRTTSVNGTNYAFWSHTSSNAFTIYAPITAGTQGLILTSNGSGAPVWSDLGSLKAFSLIPTTIYSSNANAFNYVKFASITLTDRYKGKYALLKLTRSFTTSTDKGNSCEVYVHCYQQDPLGTIPRYTIKANNINSNFNIIGLLNYSSTLSKLDLYVYDKGLSYQTINVVTIVGDNIIDIGTNISSLPEGTLIIPSKMGHVDTANNGVFYIEGTGSTAGTWLGSHAGITSYYKGLTIAYKIPIAGASTTTLNINSLGAVTCYISTSKLKTHYPVGSVVMLVYDGTYFRTADYDSTTTKVRLYLDTTNKEYPLAFRYDNTAANSSGYVSEYLRYASAITINPSTSTITATTFKGTATTASKLSTVSKTAWGLTYWTSGGVPTNISGNMTEVGSITATGNYSTSASDASDRAVTVLNTNGKVGLYVYTSRGLYDFTKNKWLIGTQGTNTFLLLGNVGIGNTTPAYSLDVTGTGRFTKSLTLSGTTSADAALRFSRTESYNYIIFPGNVDTSTLAFGYDQSHAGTYYIMNSRALYPAVDNKFNLGVSETARWKNVYATTFRGDLVGNVTGNVSGSSGSCTGNSATASKLNSTTAILAKAFSLVNTTWTDTGYTFENLTTGTYAIQVTSGSNLVASGIMSIYQNLSDTVGDEIPLHVYGTAGWRPYLRTYANKLLISSNDASATSRTVTIKIAQIL